MSDKIKIGDDVKCICGDDSGMPCGIEGKVTKIKQDDTVEVYRTDDYLDIIKLKYIRKITKLEKLL